jgi:hypothetical protein
LKSPERSEPKKSLKHMGLNLDLLKCYWRKNYQDILNDQKILEHDDSLPILVTSYAMICMDNRFMHHQKLDEFSTLEVQETQKKIHHSFINL